MGEAETLRMAAALMRERAEAAMPGPWRGTRVALRRGGSGVVVAQSEGALPQAGGAFVLCDPQSDARVEDARHMASWHPAVAFAVADLLDEYARLSDASGSDDMHAAPLGRYVVALATAYLGDRS